MPSSSRCRSTSPPPPPPLPPPPAPSEVRDWAALPQDILLAVFLKLGLRDIMEDAELVCTAWRRAAVEEPLLWRRIDMGAAVSMWTAPPGSAAVDRAAGQCEAFSGSCDDDLLFYLAERAPSLRSLHISIFDTPNGVLGVVLKKLPLLEDLEISPTYVSTSSENFIESVCQACPLLRKLTMRFRPVRGSASELTRDQIRGIVTTMCELGALELLDCHLTAEGLTAILDCCPVLESLFITGSFSGEMDEELRAKRAKVKDLALQDNWDEDYDTYMRIIMNMYFIGIDMVIVIVGMTMTA